MSTRLVAGTVVDRYRVERLLGSGGMARVYLVTHTVLGSHHAMKVLVIQAASILDRLMLEGQAQSRLAHPNIVRVTDVVEAQGFPALILEYVHGPTLHTWLNSIAVTPRQVDALAIGILQGASAAHQHGLVHRDLKPENILLSVEQGMLLPKITDFGLVKMLDDSGSLRDSTPRHVALGTPGHVAPEQIRDAKTVDSRADLFAIGTILYRVVTGRHAFLGERHVDVAQKVLAGKYRPVAEVAPQAPERMRRAIEAALISDPSARVPTADALLAMWCDGANPTTLADGAWDDGVVARSAALVKGPAPAPVSSRPSSPSDTRWRPDGWPEPSASVAALLARARSHAEGRADGYFGAEHLVWALLDDTGQKPRPAWERSWLAGLLSAYDAVSRNLLPQPGTPAGLSPTPRLAAWGRGLPTSFEDDAVLRCLTKELSPPAAPDLSATTADTWPTAAPVQATRPAGGFSVVGGPEDGRILRLRTGESLGRANPEGGPDHALYERSRLVDRKLSRQHLRWQGPGAVELLRNGVLVRAGAEQALRPGLVELREGDLLWIGAATRLRAVADAP